LRVSQPSDELVFDQIEFVLCSAELGDSIRRWNQIAGQIFDVVVWNRSNVYR
jgi:hypothetical protein